MGDLGGAKPSEGVSSEAMPDGIILGLFYKGFAMDKSSNMN